MTSDRTHCKIGKVTLKPGGPRLVCITNLRSEEMVEQFMSDVNFVADTRIEDADGYAVVMWGRRGEVSSAVKIRDGRWVGRSEVADFVKSALNAHIFGTDRD